MKYSKTTCLFKLIYWYNLLTCNFHFIHIHFMSHLVYYSRNIKWNEMVGIKSDRYKNITNLVEITTRNIFYIYYTNVVNAILMLPIYYFNNYCIILIYYIY